MEQLQFHDFQQLLSAVNILHSDVSPATLAERTLSAISKLVSADVISFDGFNPQTNQYTTHQWNNSPELMTPENLEILAQVVYDHPLFIPVIQQKQYEIFKISDFASMAEFKQTSAFNEFFNRIGVDRQIVTPFVISPDLEITCALNRVNKDFTERERALLVLFTPHLINAIQNAFVFDAVESERNRANTALSAASQGVIIVDENSHVLLITDWAVNLLKKYFPEEKDVSQILPEALRLWMRHSKSSFEEEDRAFRIPADYIVKRGTKELRVRLTYNSQTREITLLLKENPDYSPAQLVALGLTKRESEILFWMMKGKTNGEISILCNISYRTVQKHAEHIYQKLAVETRTAAMLAAMEQINRMDS